MNSARVVMAWCFSVLKGQRCSIQLRRRPTVFGGRLRPTDPPWRLAPPFVTWLVSKTRNSVPAWLVVMKELPVALVCIPIACVSAYAGFVPRPAAASLGGRNTSLNAPPVMAESTYVNPVSMGLAHEVGELIAGTI